MIWLPYFNGIGTNAWYVWYLEGSVVFWDFIAQRGDTIQVAILAVPLSNSSVVIMNATTGK